VEHRAVIEQAKGVLMLAYRLDADGAFSLLAWHSQRRNQKLHLVAARLVERLNETEFSGSSLRSGIDRLLGQDGQAPSEPAGTIATAGEAATLHSRPPPNLDETGPRR